MVQGINLSPKTFFRSDMERLKTGGVAKFDVKKDRYRLCQPGHWQDEHLVGIMSHEACLDHTKVQEFALNNEIN